MRQFNTVAIHFKIAKVRSLASVIDIDNILFGSDGESGAGEERRSARHVRAEYVSG